MADEACNLKIQALEFKHQALKDDFDEQRANVIELTTTISKISSTLNSIKYSLFGALCLGLLQIMGVSDFLKLIIFKV